ncbi:MAG: hypothetical protein B7Y02_07310 [Rhodobacterales bacterium 17-64-5]|nr:MAG: hypothetical protein B7Z31_04090 [Rhodobacterales bacterium 12-65-15]OZA12472.1 MAG: hypothetical protein B7Y02_07310 [Rhodobacterales bacterium 17-64-5]
MIHYTLKCPAGHRFDSWFASADAYAGQQDRGLVACPVCGSTDIAKDLMAPSVRPSRTAVTTPPPADRPASPDLTTPGTELETAIAALRKHLAETSDYVGVNFATEVRRMHAGDLPERAIHGEAKAEEARQLLEDGIPIAPLPFLPARKMN